MSDRKQIIGFDWADFGRNVFGSIHIAGRTLATLFGGQAGANLADTSEQFESKGHLLPDWARSNTKPGQDDEPAAPDAPPPTPKELPPQAQWNIVKADFIVVELKGIKNRRVLKAPTSVTGLGGTIRPGNKYKKGDDPTKKFSFAIDSPSSVIVSFGGQRASLDNVKTILFCGGQESAPSKVTGIEGAVMSQNKYLKGAQILGVAPINTKLGQKQSAQKGHAQFVFSKSPHKGRVFTAMVIPKTGKQTDAVTIQNAKMAAKRAEQIANKLDKLVRHTKQTKIHGLTPMGRVRSGHPTLSIGQVKKLAADLHDTGKKTTDQAVKHAAVVDLHNKKVKTGVQLTRSKLGPSGVAGQTIRGLDYDETLESQIEMLGNLFMSVVGDDPASGDGSSASPDSGSSDSGASVSGQYPGPPDYGVGPVPTMDSIDLKPNEDYVPDPQPDGVDATIYAFDITDPSDPASGLPAGAVLYDWNSQPMPASGVGSLNRFAPGVASTTPAGGGHSGFEWGNLVDGVHNDGWYLFYQTAYYDGALVDLRYKHEGNGANTFTNNQDRQSESKRQNWGPLIGNPLGHGPDDTGKGAEKNSVSLWVKGLRYDEKGDRWFWFYDKAPDFLKIPLKMKLLSQAVTAWKADLATAKANYAAQVAQDMADAQKAKDIAKQQAAEDAAAKHQADLASVQQQTQAAQDQLDQQRQQAQMEAQRQQAEIESQKQADAMLKQQTDLEAQQAQLQMKEQQQALDYYAQHPEELYQGGGGGAQQDDDGMDEASWSGPSDDQVDWGDDNARNDVPADSMDDILDDAS